MASGSEGRVNSGRTRGADGAVDQDARGRRVAHQVIDRVPRMCVDKKITVQKDDHDGRRIRGAMGWSMRRSPERKEIHDGRSQRGPTAQSPARERAPTAAQDGDRTSGRWTERQDGVRSESGVSGDRSRGGMAQSIGHHGAQSGTTTVDAASCRRHVNRHGDNTPTCEIVFPAAD